MWFCSNPKKVLIIDDDRSLLRQLKFRLAKKDKLQIVTSETAEQGLELAISGDFDLILLDWMLPDQQGIDLLHELKQKSVTRHIPVLMMTGRNKIGEVEKAFSLGADAYVTKPFELGKIGKKVSELLAT